MADFNRNAAYDLSRFAPAEVKTAPGTKEVRRPDKPEIVKEKIKTARQVREEKTLRRHRMRRAVCVCVTLLMFGGLKINGEVQVSQLEKEFRQEEALLKTAESEGVRLSTEIEKEFSFDEVQRYINLKGMQKSENYQTYRVDVEKQDEVVNYLGQPVS